MLWQTCRIPQHHLSHHLNANGKSVVRWQFLGVFICNLPNILLQAKAGVFNWAHTSFLVLSCVKTLFASSKLYIHKLPFFSVEWFAIGKYLCPFNGHLLLAQNATKGKMTVWSTFKFCASPLSFSSEHQSDLQSNKPWINPHHLHLLSYKKQCRHKKRQARWQIQTDGSFHSRKHPLAMTILCTITEE